MGKTQASIEQYCRQEAETASLAQKLAASLSQYLQKPRTHLNIALEGDLGAGKTTFARYLIQGMGHEGKVKSPTYTLCEPYPLQLNDQEITAYHFDLYRMKDPLEWQEAGFGEYFDAPGFCLIEWPEKAEGTLPPFDMLIQLSAGAEENERHILIEAKAANGMNVLQALNNGQK
ncbi:tRNA (adenosine(37)-N6)-threonylcarbamoyltransferase complex ATPase subunit type 1 TsaE [Polynucleobacter sp. 15G-AUS-farblos]|uniref:tRNA (adenosine(37)-N6)-threonylcarbamoyltransferase complex ATPase subunit type 1 TsaE n=1 Tax=Polynucleobacter sp. 15G-AUS-farblos TaxID=2689094 RepID=UPI001C0AD6C2|nr:tRNA (adenosine(37)-N6)-threonylcarbamoyltransferase complex ATPase subunit type 1 TsaE [Polynucleobacter sp. 15G-AUS-farblos]MBU3583359.1 tRNA (adenosine(37)-N6)-threonylcarbamoyltransferase complex ATPase subunit type 1 TsaE [Polynucleobacter sp. 15G-AUS-farblos]